MRWSNIRLILAREIRDQLRDRRTLFMVFVLPLLLYPFMGMSVLQLSQFAQEHPTKVFVVGREHLPKKPALIGTVEVEGEDGAKEQVERFAAEWFTGDDAEAKQTRAALLELYFPERSALDEAELDKQIDDAKEKLKDGEYQVVVVIPRDFGGRLLEFREQIAKRNGRPDAKVAVPSPEVFRSTAKKKSGIAYDRVRRVLRAWREAIIEQEVAAPPFKVRERDVAEGQFRYAAVWSAVFPFLMLIWALTGAFYPAVDLCAGEKERGTLETLLSSPAQRSEIVWGKLLTIMIFSLGTVILNIAAVAATGWFVAARLPGLGEFGPPPVLAFVWLLIAMIPVAALFSALCLAVAAFARSNKEGQYYLMPLFLITMPLVVLPMWPSFELTLGNSLIPLTGIVMVLKSAIEGDYMLALKFSLPVAIVTGLCCLAAIRWAVGQFNQESVLFRESERFDLKLWLIHLVRDRGPTPTAATAMMCGMGILLLKFFMEVTLAGSAMSFVTTTLMLQLGVILLPAVLLAVFLTSSPRKTLLLRRPRSWLAVPAAILLAATMHPLVVGLGELVQWLYPMSPQLREMAKGLLDQMPGFLMQLTLIALVAPLCEEVAFRGFILSGFREGGRKYTAIFLSSVFFGLTHSILQQSMATFVVGLLVAYLAVQSGSLLVCIAYHVTHNAILVCLGQSVGNGPLYQWPSLVAGGVLSATLLGYFAWLGFREPRREPENSAAPQGGPTSSKLAETRALS